MNKIFTVEDMQLMIEAVIHSYMIHKTRYWETSDPVDEDMTSRYKSLLVKIEKLTGKRYVTPANDPDLDKAFDKLLEDMPDPPDTEEIPDNILDFTKRRKND